MSKPGVSHKDENVIICLASNYSFEQISHFLVSRLRHCPMSRLIMLHNNLEAKIYEQKDLFDIDLVPFVPDASIGYNPMIERYLSYRAVIASLPDHCEILLTDVRDVVFQGNPFGKGCASAATAAAEDRRIGECALNTSWLSQAYGVEVARRAADKWISCAGTTIGPAAKMRLYIEAMCEQIASHMQFASLQAIDQGYHNFIIYEKEPNYVSVDQEDVTFNTVGYADRSALEIIGDAIRSVGRKEAAPVLHQWDRHPDLVAHVRRVFALPL